MGDECQKRAATDDEIKAMQEVVRDGMKAGALGLSVSRNKGHFDPQGVHIPALWADEKEIFALADVLREIGTGIDPVRRRPRAELKDGLMARLSEATGRTVVYNNLGQTMRDPDAVEEAHGAGRGDRGAGHPRLPDVQPEPDHAGLHDEEQPGVPRPADLAPDPARFRRGEAARLRRSRDPRASCTRKWSSTRPDCRRPASRTTWWNYMWVEEPVLEKNKGCKARRSARSPRSRARASSTRSSTSSSRRSSKPRSCRPRTTSTTRR